MANTFTRAPKQFFTSTMNYYSALNDSDNEWITANNDAFFKLGTGDKSLNDTVSVTSVLQIKLL